MRNSEMRQVQHQLAMIQESLAVALLNKEPTIQVTVDLEPAVLKLLVDGGYTVRENVVSWSHGNRHCKNGFQLVAAWRLAELERSVPTVREYNEMMTSLAINGKVAIGSTEHAALLHMLGYRVSGVTDFFEVEVV